MQLLQRPPDRDGYPDRIDRPRLARRLAGPTAARVAVLFGPTGSGKGELVRALRRSPDTIYYRVGNERATFARFVYGLAQAIAFVAPGAVASFPRTWERALQSHSPSTILARWLCEHLNGSDRHIAIDDLHDGAADAGIASFIATLAELRPNAPLTVAVRSIGLLPVALWMATGRMDRPIDETDLRFTRGEVATAALAFGVSLDAVAVEALLAETGGLPIAVSYALARLRYEPAGAPARPIAASFAEIAAQIFARRTERERTFLFTVSLFSNVSADVLTGAGWDDAGAIVGAIAGDGDFIWDRNSDEFFRFHDRFRDYVLEQFRSRDAAFQSAIAQAVVGSLRLAGRYGPALEVATSHRLIVTMGELLDAHGFEILEAGQIDVISEAIDAFAGSDQALGASALALRGYMEARSGHLDTAEAWFRLGLEQAEEEGSKVAIAMYYARELTLRRREDAFEVLKPFADSTTLVRAVSRPVLIDVRSSFAQALTAGDQLDEACRRTDEALALLDGDSPPTLRARVLSRAAYVALQCGKIELARERATVAAPLAVAQSLYDAAASTYSVLYNIAYEVDDDAVASIEYLQRMGDLSAKSGTLRLDLYVMLALYELYAESGDEAALAKLNAQLAGVDKHEATIVITESLLPGKALHAAWSGDFDDAQLLLRPSADRQATPARIALRWAQIGLYCAAAGDLAAAASAADRADEARSLSERTTTLYGLTLVTLALVEFLSGNGEGALRRLDAVDDAAIGPAPRLRALRVAVGLLINDWDEPDRLARNLPAALGALWSVSFGGMAKLIEALPYRSGTIGSALALHDLETHFATALGSGDAGPLYGWLDTISGLTFQGLGLIERFERWAAACGALDHHADAALRKLRRRVETYHRPAPTRLRIVDDIDASIDILFEHLDIAAPLMAEHSRAVSAWCGRLARLLSLTEDEILFVTRCGLIHDVGKTNTPPEILQAPRGLNPQEWAIMREHAAEGGRIVANVTQLRAFAPIVRAHHERLDGTGYPDGLKSAAIPLAARIVAVADSFNAMIGRRPYRLPLAPTDALNELHLHRGTQFDPDVVDAMVRIVLGKLVETQPHHI